MEFETALAKAAKLQPLVFLPPTFLAEVDVVMASHSGMTHVSAVSIRDLHWRAIGVCFMRLRVGVVHTSGDLVARARRELGACKTPAQWIVVDALPLTSQEAKIVSPCFSVEGYESVSRVLNGGRQRRDFKAQQSGTVF